jgi:hypothetical protein
LRPKLETIGIVEFCSRSLEIRPFYSTKEAFKIIEKEFFA